MRLDALLPAAHGDMLALPDRPIVADRTPQSANSPRSFPHGQPDFATHENA
jgi:hypothetical protein